VFPTAVCIRLDRDVSADTERVHVPPNSRPGDAFGRFYCRMCCISRALHSFSYLEPRCLSIPQDERLLTHMIKVWIRSENHR
jgi:hypothetical protein